MLSSSSGQSLAYLPPGFYNDFHAGDVGWLLLGAGGGLVFAWMGVRQFRNGAKVSGRKLTIRNELRTYTADACEIRAITLQPKSSSNGDYWVARVELTSGKSIWIDNFDCGPAGKPPKPDRMAAVEEVRVLLGVRTDNIQQPGNQSQPGAEDAKAERLPVPRQETFAWFERAQGSAPQLRA